MRDLAERAAAGLEGDHGDAEDGVAGVEAGAGRGGEDGAGEIRGDGFGGGEGRERDGPEGQVDELDVDGVEGRGLDGDEDVVGGGDGGGRDGGKGEGGWVAAGGVGPGADGSGGGGGGGHFGWEGAVVGVSTIERCFKRGEVGLAWSRGSGRWIKVVWARELNDLNLQQQDARIGQCSGVRCDRFPLSRDRLRRHLELLGILVSVAHASSLDVRLSQSK